MLKENLDRPKYSGLDISDFERVLRYVSFSTAKKGQVEYDRDELLISITKAKKETGLTFKESDFLKDLTTTVPLFVVEGNMYSWAHKSLQDYFAAKFIEVGIGDKKVEILKRIYHLDDINRFYNILDIFYDLDNKTFRNTILLWLMNEISDHFDSKQMEYPVVNTNLSIRRRQCTFGRKVIIKIYSTDDSKNIRAAGKQKQEYLKQDFLKYKPDGVNYSLRYNQNDENYLALFIESNTNKTALLKLLFEKHMDFVSHSFFLNINQHHSLPENSFLEVNNDINSPLNDGDNFHYVTELLKIGYTINYDAFLKERLKLNEEIKMQEDSDLLDF